MHDGPVGIVLAILSGMNILSWLGQLLLQQVFQPEKE